MLITKLSAFVVMSNASARDDTLGGTIGTILTRTYSLENREQKHEIKIETYNSEAFLVIS